MVCAARCRECGQVRFPAPIVCVCGSERFAAEPLSTGCVEATTALAGAQGAALAVVRTDSGHRVVARSDRALDEGTTVLIECRNTIIRVVHAGSTEDEGV